MYSQLLCLQSTVSSGDVSLTDGGSPVSVASFNEALDNILSWLGQASETLTSQSPVANDIDSLKEQFHHHEVCLFYS